MSLCNFVQGHYVHDLGWKKYKGNGFMKMYSITSFDPPICAFTSVCHESSNKGDMTYGCNHIEKNNEVHLC
jgi:hypothetical protein